MSRPRPRGEVGGSGQGGLAQTQGGGWEVWWGRGAQAHGGCPGPGPGGPGPHLGWVSRPGEYIPACTEADTHPPPPHSRRLLSWAVRILLECILVFESFPRCEQDPVYYIPM